MKISNIRQQIYQLVNKSVSYETWKENQLITLILAGAFLSVTFAGKHVISHELIPNTPFITDFTRYFLYFSDILGILLIWQSLKQKIWPNKIIIPLLLWLVFQILFIAEFHIFSAYLSVRLILVLLLFSFILKNPINKGKDSIVKLIIALGALQSVLGIYQFMVGKSVGLSLFGESPLDLTTSGIATISLYGHKILRAYGTFPHPNLLSAFLIMVNIILIYLLHKTIQKTTWWKYVIFYVVNLIGLMMTLSRAGILLGVLSIQFLLLLWLWAKFPTDKLKILFLELLTILCLIGFSPYLVARSTINDTSTHERVMFTDIAIKSIKNNGLLGVGLGNGLFHMKQYTEAELKPWEYQPIHNYYLIALVELGLGALTIFWLLAVTAKKILSRVWNDYKRTNERFTWNIVLMTIFGSYLLLNLFDHYFYTLWPGQILFWTITGLTLSAADNEG